MKDGGGEQKRVNEADQIWESRMLDGSESNRRSVRTGDLDPIYRTVSCHLVLSAAETLRIQIVDWDLVSVGDAAVERA